MQRVHRVVWRASLALIVCGASCLPAQAQTIGSSMVTFLNGKLSTRVGGGECAHMAIEALRASGGEFYATDLGEDSPATGDYVWGHAGHDDFVFDRVGGFKSDQRLPAG